MSPAGGRRYAAPREEFTVRQCNAVWPCTRTISAAVGSSGPQEEGARKRKLASTLMALAFGKAKRPEAACIDEPDPPFPGRNILPTIASNISATFAELLFKHRAQFSFRWAAASISTGLRKIFEFRIRTQDAQELA